MNGNITSFQLKLIAIIAMTVNHIGYIFSDKMNNPIWEFSYLFIGYLTFPIMSFFLIEGFYLTKNYYKYLLRMISFWIISIIPFALTLDNGKFNLFNNIFFVLSLGLIMIPLLEKNKDIVLKFLIVFSFTFLTSVLNSDWGLFGIPTIFAFYINKNHLINYKIKSYFQILVILIILLVFGDISKMLATTGLLMINPVLERYNYKKGLSNNFVKYVFYLYYPLHLILLFLIKKIIY